MLNASMEPNWKTALQKYFQSQDFENLTNFVTQEYQTKTIFPEIDKVFEAFWQTPFNQVRVVILGQDPYHGINQAHGLSFSVPTGVKVPPSLKNIYKEIEREFGAEFDEFGEAKTKKDFTNGNLEPWTKQGVFLLNSVLTVESGKPASHQKKGWENFTDLVISKLSDQKEHVVFILWGNFAKSKKTLIDSHKHLILEAAHPSPFSAYNGFFGCNHFIKCNEYLKANELGEINW